MSGPAEQLRALDEVIAPVDAAYPHTWADNNTARLIALRNALPALADVVEAAQAKLDAEWREFADDYYPEDGEDAASTPNTELAHRKLADALARLSEVLNGEPPA